MLPIYWTKIRKSSGRPWCMLILTALGAFGRFRVYSSKLEVLKIGKQKIE
jgi:hypothetical protein